MPITCDQGGGNGDVLVVTFTWAGVRGRHHVLGGDADNVDGARGGGDGVGHGHDEGRHRH